MQDIRIQVNEVYRPDVTLLNSVLNDNVFRTSTHSDMVLWANGLINWMPAVSLRTVCDVDLTEWPFDEQTCSFRFASWTYEGSAMNIINSCTLSCILIEN